MGLFFNVRKPRGYNPTPIFHNPEKEALEERILRKKKEMGMLEEGEYVKCERGIPQMLRHVRRRKNNPEKSSTNTNVKLAVVLIVLILIFYWFYFR
ncbi:hypothetical protein MASR1M31_11960 [Porphyromonadaceae bacterium]